MRYVIGVYYFGDCVKRYVETSRQGADLVVQAVKALADDDWITTIIFEVKLG